MVEQNIQAAVANAYKYAVLNKHEYVSIEHFLLVLLDDLAVFRALNLDANDIDDLRTKLRKVINELNESTPPASEGKDPFTQPANTLGLQRVIKRALLHAESTNRKDVDGADALLAIFGEKDSHAVHLLKQKGVDRLHVARFISTGVLQEHRSQKQEVQLSVNAIAPEGKPPPPSPVPKLFISYSHADTECLDRLLVHLRPLQRSGAIACWSDKNIKTGSKWRSDIEKNLAQASIAILLISADFLASDFIVNNELPPMLLRAEAAGLRILPVILKPCGFKRDKVLSTFQAANDGLIPLLSLTHVEQEELWDKIAGEIAEEIAQAQSFT